MSECHYERVSRDGRSDQVKVCTPAAPKQTAPTIENQHSLELASQLHDPSAARVPHENATPNSALTK